MSETATYPEVKVREAQSLEEACEMVVGGEPLVIIHNAGFEEVGYEEKLDKLNHARNLDYGWRIAQSDHNVPLPDSLEASFESIGYQAIHEMVNNYQPGDSIPEHIDFEGIITPGEDYREFLTFIYVVSGQKKLSMYLNGDENPPVDVEQTPDMMMVFRGGSMLVDDKVLPALTHGVTPQDATCKTLTFELMPV